MQIRRVSNTYLGTTFLPFAVAILLIIGHVAGHTDNEKNGQKMDTLFNIYRRLATRYKKDLEKFNAPGFNQPINVIRANDEDLTAKETLSHEEQGKRNVRSPVASPEPTPCKRSQPYRRISDCSGPYTRCNRRSTFENPMPRLAPMRYSWDTSIRPSQYTFARSEVWYPTSNDFDIIY